MQDTATQSVVELNIHEGISTSRNARICNFVLAGLIGIAFSVRWLYPLYIESRTKGFRIPKFPKAAAPWRTARPFT